MSRLFRVFLIKFSCDFRFLKWYNSNDTNDNSLSLMGKWSAY